MAEPIKVGDLVAVVKGHCTTKYIGKIFRVAEVGQGRGRCNECRAEMGTVAYVIGEENDAYPMVNVKRIPPLSELEGEKRDEEITA